jgi:ABC-type amino acid transport substrate-binding protein
VRRNDRDTEEHQGNRRHHARLPQSSIPFSYLDDSQKPVGYAMDICYKIVDAVKKDEVDKPGGQAQR